MPYLPFKVEKIYKGSSKWNQIDSKVAYDDLYHQFGKDHVDNIILSLQAGFSVETPFAYYRRMDDD